MIKKTKIAFYTILCNQVNKQYMTFVNFLVNFFSIYILPTFLKQLMKLCPASTHNPPALLSLFFGETTIILLSKLRRAILNQERFVPLDTETSLRTDEWTKSSRQDQQDLIPEPSFDPLSGNQVMFTAFGFAVIWAWSFMNMLKFENEAHIFKKM